MALSTLLQLYGVYIYAYLPTWRPEYKQLEDKNSGLIIFVSLGPDTHLEPADVQEIFI